MTAALRDAGLARRVGALLMDAALLACVFGALNLVLWKSGAAAALASDPEAGVLSLWSRPHVVLGSAGVIALAVLLAWRTMGATPGALLLGVVLRPPGGGRPGLARACARLLVALALGGLGTLWSVGGRAALHDRVSGLRLVMEDETWSGSLPRGRAAVS